MSGFFRRLAALLLGVIVGVAGGAFWTYQNIKPLQMVGNNKVIEGTEISDASVEELAELIIKAANNPDDFSFARLEKEYGLDLKKILEQAGINTDNASKEDMNALQNVSLLSFINGAESFLDNIKLRALYVILPSVMDKDLDEILSKEAQAALGDYTLWQLLNSDAATEELGLITAIKALKVGSLLPSMFDANYNADKHEYTYAVKEDSNLKILNLVADLPLKAVIDLANGTDPIKSMMEGELKVLGDKPLTEVLSTIFSVFGEQTQEKLNEYTRVLGDSKLSDLFEVKGDKYVLTFNNVAEDIDFGYIFGYEKGEDGVWYKDKEMTKPVDGLLGVLADLDLKGIIDADGDVIKTITAVAGDMSIATLYETFASGKKVPAFVQALSDFTVGDLLRNGTKEILPTVIENLNMYVGDWTLGQALNDVLKPADKEKIENSALLNGLMNLRFGDLLKEEYTADTFINAFDNALGDIELGAIIGKTKVDGKWQGVNNVLGIALDITMGDIFDVMRADNYTEAVKALFGNITIGDFYGAIFNYTSTDEDPVYHKGDKYVTDGFNDFLNLEFWKLLVSFDKNSGYNIMNDVKKLTVGDVVYSGVGTFMNVSKYLVYENGEVAVKGDRFGEASKVLLNETIGNYMANYKSGSFWKDKFTSAFDKLQTKDKYVVLGGVGAVGAVLYYVDNPFLVKLVKNIFGENAIWYDVLGKTLGYSEVDGKFIGGEFYNSFMDKFLHENIAETLTKGYPFLKNFKEYITIGNLLTITDKLNTQIEKTIKKEFVAGDNGGIALGGDLINLTDFLFDIPLSSVTKENGSYKITLPYEFNNLMLGDLFAFYTNSKSNTGFKATLSQDRKSWTVECEKLQEIYNNVFNLTIGEVRNNKGELLSKILGDTLLSELVSAFDTAWQNDSFLVQLYNVKAVDFIELITGNALLKDVYGTVTVGDALGGYFGANLKSDPVVTATLDLTIGEIADVFTAPSKKVAVKALIFDLYRDLYVRDFVNTAAKFANMSVENYINKLPTGKKLINKVLDYQIGYFEVSTKAQIKAMLDDLYIGDMVVELARKVDNRFAFLHHDITENEDGTYFVQGDFAVLGNKLYNLSLGELYKMFLNKTELRDYIYSFKLGDLGADIARMGYNYIMKYLGTQRRHYFEYLNGEYIASGDFALVADKVYNLTVEEAYKMLKNKTLLKDFVAEFKVGDFIGELAPAVYNKFLKRFNRTHSVEYVNGEYVSSGDFAVAADRVYNLNILDAFRMVKTPANLKNFVGQFKLGDFAADIVPVIYRKFTSRFDRTYTVGYVNGEYVVDGDLKALSEKLYNLTVLDAYQMFMDNAKLRAFVGKLKVGDFVADFSELVLNKFLSKYNNRSHEVNYVDGTYTVNGSLAELFEVAYNLTGSDLLDVYRKPLVILDKFDMPMGVYVKYMTAGLRWFDSNRFNTKVVKNDDGTYTVGGSYAALFENVVNISLKDLYNNLRTGKTNYILNELLGNVRVGNLMGGGKLYFNEDTQTWFKENGEELTFSSNANSIIMNKVYKLYLRDIKNLDAEVLLDGLYVGELSGYTCANTEAGHVHNDSCVWLGLKKVYNLNGELIEVNMPLDAKTNVTAQISIVNFIRNGISFESMLGDMKLGELLGLCYNGDAWYEYKTVNGYRVIDENNNYVLADKAPELNQAIANIGASELLGNNGTQAVIDAINDLKLGYVLGYEYNEELNVWSNSGLVEGAMGKMANYTVNEIKNNFNYIISHELTFGDVLPKDMLNSNEIFKYLENTTLANATEELYKMEVGTFMGYERKGSNWYRNGEKVDDEILTVLANYCYGEFAGATGYELYDENGNQVTFMKHLMTNMSKNVTIKVLYPDAGKADADGFNALLDANWTLKELPDRLMNRLQTETSVEQLIKLGVFGDYFVVADGETVQTTRGENFVKMDKVFETLTDNGESDIRTYWTSLTMPKFMESIMSFVVRMQNAGTVGEFIELGIFQDYFAMAGGETLETAQGQGFKNMDKLYNALHPEVGESNIRAYWLNLTMQEFMDSLSDITNMIDKLSEYQTKIDELQSKIDQLQQMGGLNP